MTTIPWIELALGVAILIVAPLGLRTIEPIRTSRRRDGP